MLYLTAKIFSDTDGVFYCVTGKKRSTVTYRKKHLSICDKCVIQGGNISLKEPEPDLTGVTVVLPEPAKAGEQPPVDAHGNEIYTPIKVYEKLIGYQRSDGGKLCPFEKGLITCKFVCYNCGRNYPAKHEACLTLLRSHAKNKRDNKKEL
jgi:hypothetical protein